MSVLSTAEARKLRKSFRELEQQTPLTIDGKKVLTIVPSVVFDMLDTIDDVRRVARGQAEKLREAMKTTGIATVHYQAMQNAADALQRAAS